MVKHFDVAINTLASSTLMGGVAGTRFPKGEATSVEYGSSQLIHNSLFLLSI